jgi:hypothetical protein
MEAFITQPNSLGTPARTVTVTNANEETIDTYDIPQGLDIFGYVRSLYPSCPTIQMHRNCITVIDFDGSVVAKHYH